MNAALLEPLANFTAGFSMAKSGIKDNERLFMTLCDWSSALLAGLGHPLYQPYLKALAPLLSETGPASIIGQPHGRPMAAAAAANAAISHLWEVDDIHKESTSHPGIAILPVVIALAQAFPAILPDRIRSAVIVGYETILRIGAFLGKAHYSVSHTTATAGSFGAAAASAHMLGLAAEPTLWAFGHAGTQAQGLWQILEDDAREAKGFHAAIAARNGTAAAMMARAGLKGSPRVLEGRRGLLAVWHLNGGDPDWLQPKAERMIDQVTIKNWPTCGQMHSALDCAVQLHKTHSYAISDIRSVTVEVPQACRNIADVCRPQTVDAAKFSTRFCVAAALAGHPPNFRGLQPSLLNKNAVHELAERVSLVVNSDFSRCFPHKRPARVTIDRLDGSAFSAERAFRKGDPEAPWQRDEFLQRTDDTLSLAGRGLDCAALIDWCDRFADSNCSDWQAGEIFRLANPQALDRTPCPSARNASSDRPPS